MADIEAESREEDLEVGCSSRTARACAPPAAPHCLAHCYRGPYRIGGWATDRPNCARRDICTPRVMARNILVDAGFVIALLSSRDAHHQWAVTQASELPPPWSTCEAVLSEAFRLSRRAWYPQFRRTTSPRRSAGRLHITENLEPVVKLMEKYSNVPMGFADVCLVRMTETFADPIILTTDQDFQVYRRHSRQVVPCVTPE